LLRQLLSDARDGFARVADWPAFVRGVSELQFLVLSQSHARAPQ
jgi:hypothetical protein